VLNLTEELLSNFGFTDYEIMLSTRPDKAVGSDEIWDDATKALREALDLKGWDYGIDEGGGAFYGPKIDLKIKDAIGRSWQCSTIQVRVCTTQRELQGWRACPHAQPNCPIGALTHALFHRWTSTYRSDSSCRTTTATSKSAAPS